MKTPGSAGDFFLRHWLAIVVIAAVVLGVGGAAAYFALRDPVGKGAGRGGNESLTEEAVPEPVEEIVFERGQNIWAMNPDGSGQRQLTFNGYDYHPALSPDGEHIVFTRYAGDPNQASAASAAPPAGELFIMDSNGKNPKRLSPSDWATSKGWTPMFDIQKGTKWRRRSCVEPSFSTSGKIICFVVSDYAYQEAPGGAMGNYGLSGIAVMQLEGDEPSGTDIVYKGKGLYGGESFGSPEFCKAGCHIFFTYGAGGGPPGISIERIDSDGNNRKAILPCKNGRGAGPDKGYYAFDLSPDGETMVCVELTIDQGRVKTWLFLADIDGSKRRNVPTDGATVGTESVSFSPDGLRLVFTGGTSAASAQAQQATAYIINADGNGMAQIASDITNLEWGRAVK